MARHVASRLALMTGLVGLVLAVAPGLPAAAEPTPSGSAAATSSPTTAPAETSAPSNTAPATTPADGTPAPTTPAPTTTPPGTPPPTPGPGQVTVTAEANCTTDTLDVTIENESNAAVTVKIVPGPPTSVTVPARTTEVVKIQPEPVTEYVITWPGGETRFFWAFPCPVRHDLHIRVRSGTSFVSESFPPCFFGRPQHGQVETLPNSAFRYTPNRGYVGPDRFDYECVASAEQFGTVFVTVLPPIAARTTPPPAQPIGQVPGAGPPANVSETAGALASTGASVWIPLLAGVALLLAGATLAGLARARRS